MSGPYEEKTAPLRILYSFPHAWGASGIGTTAYGQVTALARQGHSVTLLAASTARSGPPGVNVVRTLQAGRLRVPHRALGGVERALSYHDAATELFLRAAVRRGRAFDVVHGWPLGSRRTLAAARRMGVPGFREVPNCHTEHAYAVVGQVMQELGLELPPGHSHRFDAARLRREEREYTAAARLLVPSPFVEQTFRERGFPAEALARHRYGFDPARIPAPVPAPAGPPGPLRAVFLGRCEPRKGLHLALRAWRRSRAAANGTFSVVGAFVPGYAEALADDLAQPGVRVVGPVGDIAAVLGAADVLVLPSFEEGSALVTYEAQAAGVVPLVSAAAGAYLEHGVHGLVHDVGDVGRLTAQLDLLAESPAELARLRAGALGHREELTWDAASRVVVGHYRAAMAAMAARG